MLSRSGTSETTFLRWFWFSFFGDICDQIIEHSNSVPGARYIWLMPLGNWCVQLLINGGSYNYPLINVCPLWFGNKSNPKHASVHFKGLLNSKDLNFQIAKVLDGEIVLAQDENVLKVDTRKGGLVFTTGRRLSESQTCWLVAHCFVHSIFCVLALALD